MPSSPACLVQCRRSRRRAEAVVVRSSALVNARRHLPRCRPVRFPAQPADQKAADLAELVWRVRMESDAALNLYANFMKAR